MASDWSICRIRDSVPAVFELVEVAAERLIHPLRLTEARALHFLVAGAGLSMADARERLATAREVPCPTEPVHFVVETDDETRAAIRDGWRKPVYAEGDSL